MANYFSDKDLDWLVNFRDGLIEDKRVLELNIAQVQDEIDSRD